MYSQFWWLVYDSIIPVFTLLSLLLEIYCDGLVAFKGNVGFFLTYCLFKPPLVCAIIELQCVSVVFRPWFAFFYSVHLNGSKCTHYLEFPPPEEYCSASGNSCECVVRLWRRFINSDQNNSMKVKYITGLKYDVDGALKSSCYFQQQSEVSQTLTLIKRIMSTDFT